jgi:dGTPase
MLRRKALEEFAAWRDEHGNRALLVTGARQVGKTYLVREFLHAEYENVVEDMFVAMYERLLEDLVSGDESSPVFRHHVKSLLEKSLSMTRDEYLSEEPNQIVVDYISSMTDSYFMALYRYLFPEDSRRLLLKDYCASLRRK